MAATESSLDIAQSTVFQATAASSKFMSAPSSHLPTEFSKENLVRDSPNPRDSWPLPTLPADTLSRSHGAPLAPLHANASQSAHSRPYARAASFESGDDAFLRQPIRRSATWETDPKTYSDHTGVSGPALPTSTTIPYRQRITTEATENLQRPRSAFISSVHIADLESSRRGSSRPSLPHSRHTSGGSLENISENGDPNQPVQAHFRPFDQAPSVRFTDSHLSRPRFRSSQSASPPLSRDDASGLSNRHLGIPSNSRTGTALSRPASAYSSSSEHGIMSRERSPQRSPGQYPRVPSSNSGRSPDGRPISYIDLLNVPYPQPPPAPTNLDNAHLRTAVGNNASLLTTKQTLEMYRANVKKTNDPTIQYEFAVFMVNTAQEAASNGQEPDVQRRSSQKSGRDDIYNPSLVASQAELLREARNILQRLSDRSYPFAQYYLADGYASGLFNKGVEDYDRAFPLFIAASKHGHAEAGYRAALCYEFGWGTRKDPLKAVQFYRHSASKNHPGAMSRLGKACLMGDMGLGSRYREGLKWLKRASESADYQYNSAPYELGILHETGFGDDIFQDKSYAAQLFTQSADLGHIEANYRLGDAYEHGKLSCPRDPALSVHFYTGAAQKAHPLAMMALCAWYMVGAEPVLEKDENEAYEWAKKAAGSGELKRSTHVHYQTDWRQGLPKAEYAVGYFTEMGIGCRRDPLEANVWYVKAADHGDERAKHRIAAIRAAASGAGSDAAAQSMSRPGKKSMDGNVVNGKEEDEKGRSKKWHIF